MTKTALSQRGVPTANDVPTPESYGALCVCHAMRKTARAVTRRYEKALKPLGISAGQHSILAVLNDGRRLPMGALAAALGMDRTTLTRDLKPLQRKGLVADDVHPDDRRVRVLKITEAGHALVIEALPLWQAAQRDSFDRLKTPDWDALRDRLEALSE